MTPDGSYGDWNRPPPPRPRRRNAVIARLYDAPLQRDPLFWWTAGVAVLMVAIFSTDTTPTSMPRWLNATLAVVVMTFLFAVLPAILRLQLRRLIWRRRKQRAPSGSTEIFPVGGPAAEPPAGTNAFTLLPTSAELQVPPERWDELAAPPDAHGHQSRRVVEPAVPHIVPPAPRRLPVPAEPLPEDAVINSDVLRAARHLQYPIARAVRSLQAASTPKDQYEALLDSSDALTVTLGASAAAWLRSVDDRADGLRELHQAYERGVTQGT